MRPQPLSGQAPISAAGIILGGSHIWRADSARALEPRLLLPVANVPLVTYALNWFRRAGVQQVVICANEGTRLVQRRLRDGGGQAQLQYFVDRMPRGPAGCLRDASELVAADVLVVVDGSVLPTLDLRAMLAAHARRGSAATLAVQVGAGRGVDEPHDAPPVGVHVFSRQAVHRVSPGSYQDLKETLIPLLLRAGDNVTVFPTDLPAPRISDRRTYLGMQSWALQLAGPGDGLHSEYTWQESTAIHPTARLAATARLVGPVMVGAGTQIEDRALLVGPVVIGRDGVIAKGALVANSVLWDRVVLEPYSRVDSCIIGSDALIRKATFLHGLIFRGFAGADRFHLFGDRAGLRRHRTAVAAAALARVAQTTGIRDSSAESMPSSWRA